MRCCRGSGSMIGMVFQQFNLFRHMTALDNVMSGPVQVLHAPKRRQHKTRTGCWHWSALEDKAASYPDQFSGGQQQRVAIARSLAMHPEGDAVRRTDLLAGPGNGAEVLQVMLDLSQQGMTMIIVTHEIQFANKAARSHCFHGRWQIVEQGRPEELVANPRNERTQKFLRLVTGKV